MEEVYAIAGVSKQAHHQYQLRQDNWAMFIEELRQEVNLIRSQHPGCGLEKMYWIINPEGIGRDRFIATFQALGYGVRKKKNFRRTTTPTHVKFPNLITGMRLDGPNQLWQTDITYWFAGTRFYYITFIIDAYTKEIKGYAVKDHLRAEANMEALKMAFRHSPASLQGLIHHSDRGSQYVDIEYQNLLKQRGIHISMGLKAQDNAYAERINGTIKNEYLNYRSINNFRDLNRHLKQAIENYNEKRPHKHLPKRYSPIKFAKQLLNSSDQDRPTVIVYAEGNCKIKGALSPHDFKPRTGPLAHDCPIVTN